MTARTSDFLVIGGGVLGIAIARELAARHPSASIRVLEKERDCGEHASGRNSGVVHAGFYYSADSLKARFTRDGNARLTAFCRERGIHMLACGKLVVTRSTDELPALDELLRRGRANGVEVHRVSEREAHELEPLARTHEAALWSPRTASVDPLGVLAALVRDAEERGIRVDRGVAYRSRLGGNRVRTSVGEVHAGYVVNTAGLHADRVARDFGFSQHHRILPFKGLYLKSSGALPLRRHVYPVPDPKYPFLGVHFTVTADGHVKVGPTAIPALWREQYGFASRFSLRDLAEIGWRQAGLFLRNDFDFRRLAATEIRKYRRAELVRLARQLVPSAEASDFTKWGRPGIRAQLVDTRSGTMEMDFRYEGDDRSFHVLNAVSPAFTCALAFAEHLVSEMSALMSSAAAGPVSASGGQSSS